jgi:peptide/nickel transport system permease protein
MLRFIVRRLLIFPPALLVINFLAFAYARVAQRNQLALNPFLAISDTSDPIWPDYLAYLGAVFGREPVTLPNSEASIVERILTDGGISLGLLALAFLLSLIFGLVFGLWGTRSDPASVRGWLPILSTFGQAMPSFFTGSLLIVGSLFIALAPFGGSEPPLPLQGFGWDKHLVMPVLALMVLPTVRIAQMTAALLSSELTLQYVKVSRAVGHTWRSIRWRLAMRNALPPITLTIAQVLRLLIAELILVEWLFTWPGLGRLLAATLVPSETVTSGGTALSSSLFLYPPLLAALTTLLAFIYLTIDLVASLTIQAVDPRLRADEGSSS